MTYEYEKLERNADSLFNKSIFLSVYEDLIIYVEDEDLGGVYEVLLNRIFDNTIKYEKIHLSGGKQKVKDLFEIYSKNPIVPSFFIVDLDYDIILNNELIKADNFVYLQRYSIENYLLSDIVGINLLNSRLAIGREQCLLRLDFNNWINIVQNELKFLNSLFISIQYLALDIVNTSKNAEEFLKEKSWEIDTGKINKYFQEVQLVAYRKNKLDELNHFIDEFNEVQNSMFSHNLWHIIPGKILLKIYYKYLVELFPKRKKQLYFDEDLYYLSAVNCDIEPMAYIREKVDLYLKDYSPKLN
jgi:hypothetical protein